MNAIIKRCAIMQFNKSSKKVDRTPGDQPSCPNNKEQKWQESRQLRPTKPCQQQVGVMSHCTLLIQEQLALQK
jgi:hypothetical protein